MAEEGFGGVNYLTLAGIDDGESVWDGSVGLEIDPEVVLEVVAAPEKGQAKTGTQQVSVKVKCIKATNQANVGRETLDFFSLTAKSTKLFRYWWRDVLGVKNRSGDPKIEHLDLNDFVGKQYKATIVPHTYTPNSANAMIPDAKVEQKTTSKIEKRRKAA